MLAAGSFAAALALALLGWGYALRRLATGSNRMAPRDRAADLIAGLYVALLLGEAAPFFFASDPRPGLIFLAGGALLFVRQEHGYSGLRGWISTAAAFAAFALVSAKLTLHANLTYDSGLYHFGFIRWMAEKGTTLGLANLHGRFGFNSSWLAAAALFSKGPDWQYGPIVWTVSVTLLLYAGLFVKAAWAMRTGRRSCFIFCVFAGVICLDIPASWEFLRVTQTDLPATLLVLHAFAASLAIHQQPEARGPDYMPLALAAAAAITVKLSSVPVILLFVPAIAAWLSGRLAVRSLAPAMAVLVSLPLVWVAQNLALSGCAAYPAAVTCLDLPWSVTAQTPRNDAAWITSWARKPRVDPDDPFFANFHWVRDWAANNRDFLTRWAKLVALGGVIMAVGLYRRRRSGLTVLAWPAAVTVTGVVAWFLSAPDPRFAMGYLIALPAFIFTAGTWSWPRPLMLLLALCVPVVKLPGFALQMMTGTGTGILHGAIPQPALAVKTTASGLAITVPSAGNQCWLADLPCAPSFNPRLSAGPVGSYGSFFMSDR